MDNSRQPCQRALPERHYPTHPPALQRDNAPVIVLVTACILDRKPILAQADAHQALVTAWRSTLSWVVGTYVIMPDHAHLFIAPGTSTPEAIEGWARYWKRLAGQACPRLIGSWQMDVWDTQMRSAEHYLHKLEYVRQNPVRTGLATTPDEWPYQGTITPLHWIGG